MNQPMPHDGEAPPPLLPVSGLLLGCTVLLGALAIERQDPLLLALSFICAIGGATALLTFMRVVGR